MSTYPTVGRLAARKARLAELTAPSKPFYGVLCAYCRRLLEDSAGNPRWDIVGKLTFVCQGGCR